jgi:hypothetical protein
MPSVKIGRSDRDGKKMKAVFIDHDGGKKTIHFGAEGMSDYTKNKDDERKKRYLARHKKNENWSDPKTAGSLSRHILWNKKSLSASIADFKNKFNLK